MQSFTSSEDEVGPKLDLPGSDVADRIYGLATGGQQSATPRIAYTASSSCEISVAENGVVPCIQEHALKIEAEPFADGDVLRDTYVLEEAVRPIEDQSLVIRSGSCIRVNELGVCSGD